MNQWQMELAFARLGHFDCFLLAGRYGSSDQTALPEFLPYCVEHGISVVAGGPYNSGILAVGPREGATFNYRGGLGRDDGQGPARGGRSASAIACPCAPRRCSSSWPIPPSPR